MVHDSINKFKLTLTILARRISIKACTQSTIELCISSIQRQSEEFSVCVCVRCWKFEKMKLKKNIKCQLAT